MNKREEYTIEELKKRLEQSREADRNSTERVRALVNTIPAGLFITDVEGVVKVANPAALELFRCTYPELRSIPELFRLEGSMADALAISNTNQSKEVFGLRPDGSQFPASIKVSTFTESNELRVLLAFEDISAEYELEQLKQEFLSMMTHDLRTPLSSLRCFLELVSEGVFDGKEEELKKKSKVTVDSATRLINMINSLLDLHKLEAGRLKIIMQDVPVASIVNQSLASLTSLAESKGISMSVSATSNDLVVKADVNYTVQVLVNLLSNAIKFSDNNSPVFIRIEELDGFVRIIVRDRGRGIPKEFQSKLFNRFEQARISDARILGGSGLGLAISKAIVEEQGGTIGVVSEPGMGCDFWFTLKRAIKHHHQ